MIFGNTPTYPLHDRASSPSESLPWASAIMWDDRFTGSAGRTALRKLLGKEHGKSDLDIPGLKGFPVWRFILRDGHVKDAPKDADITDCPTVYLLGPTAKRFMSFAADKNTTGSDAAIILRAVADRLGVDHPGQ